MKNLPSPRAKLAGCVWFARIRAKAVLLGAGDLGGDYEPFFCHPKGVDGQFLRFFSLDRDRIVEVAGRSEGEIVAWFSSLPQAAPDRIEEWNHLAENLGRKGFPMAEQFARGMQGAYQRVAHLEPATIFEALEADDNFEPEGAGAAPGT